MLQTGMSNSTTTNCPVCHQPVTGPHGAEITHLACALEASREVREAHLAELATLVAKQRGTQ